MQTIKLKGDGPIVAVDDQLEYLDLLKIVVRRSQLENQLILFPSGPDLLAHLEKVKAGEEEMPSIVLMDVNMPEMDGFETVKQLRRDRVFHDLPIVVMLTTSNSDKDMKRAEEVGANFYKVKPHSFNEFVEFLNSLLPEE